MFRNEKLGILDELKTRLSEKNAAEICDLVEEGEVEYLYDTSKKDGEKQVWAQKSSIGKIPVILFYYLEHDDDSLGMSVDEWTTRAHHVAAGSGDAREVVWSRP